MCRATLYACPSPSSPGARFPTGIAYPRPVDPTGRRLPSPGQARGKGFRRVASNAYVPAHVDPTVPEQRIIEAAAHLRGHAVVTGWAALRLWGVAYADGWRGAAVLPVRLTGATTGRRCRPGVALGYESVPDHERADETPGPGDGAHPGTAGRGARYA